MADEVDEKDLYRKHRPNSFKGVRGQDSAVQVLTDLIGKKKVPAAILFTGPSGVGKTTLARILAAKLGCVSDSNFTEVNCADFRGIDMVRDMRRSMHQHPVGGEPCRVYLIDEAHQLSKDAQNGILKLLEDPPKHVHFVLATTEPNKLLPTIHTRCLVVALKGVSPKALEDLVRKVAGREDAKLSDEVIEKIVNKADGSARKALVLLQSVIGIDDEERQLEIVGDGEIGAQAIEIAKLLLKPGGTWAELAKVLRKIDEEPESLRWMILGYMTPIVLGGGKMAARANYLIQQFRGNYFDTKRAGLVSDCFEAMLPRR